MQQKLFFFIRFLILGITLNIDEILGLIGIVSRYASNC